eukprot:517282_1
MATLILVLVATFSMKAAPTVATCTLSAGTTWLKHYATETFEEEASKNNIIDADTDDDDTKIQRTHTSFNSSIVPRHQIISKALTKKLESMEKGINKLREKDFKSAQRHYRKAMQWSHEPAFNKCIDAMDSIVEPYDKIYLYSLYISCGFIYRSKYGKNDNNYISGLKHIYETLEEMNADKELRQEIGAAFGRLCYFAGKDKKLLKSVIYFAVRTRSFIEDVQRCIQ